MKSLLLSILLIIPCLVFSQASKLHIYGENNKYFVVDRIISYDSSLISGTRNSYPTKNVHAVLFYERPDASISNFLKSQSILEVDRYTSGKYSNERENAFKKLYPKSYARGFVSKSLRFAGVALITGTLIAILNPSEGLITPDEKKRITDKHTRLLAIGGLSFSFGIFIDR